MLSPGVLCVCVCGVYQAASDHLYRRAGCTLSEERGSTERGGETSGRVPAHSHGWHWICESTDQSVFK